jgi:hypothetical protein
MIQCYHERKTYLVNEQCPVHRLALAKRRVFLLEAEREWAMSILEEYKEEIPHHIFPGRSGTRQSQQSPRISPRTSKRRKPSRVSFILFHDF